ncbi:radical SAM protein [Sphingobacteriales bacterium UPWRP_1]|nr:hypothetical protein BVG80_11560 [Sphingobacteriales bacterium TSM_CSM]PSJ76481.1 radical SAM protein [Sphingobacteriales bacterium UPWRP_1]
MIVTGVRKRLLDVQMRLKIALLALLWYKNPLTAIAVLRKFFDLRRQHQHYRYIPKLMVVNGRRFSRLIIPGAPSAACRHFIKNEMHRLQPITGYQSGLQVLLLAITKKCPLQCRHCFEWKALNHKETLTLTHLKEIVKRFQDMGVAQIELSGGEPMNRFDDMLELLKTARKNTDFWLLTSGYGLTADKTNRLKQAGLTGVSVSLDHWNPDLHDAFRGMNGSFNWVEKAVQHALQAKLVVALSVCVTKEFCTRQNLYQYAQLAKDWGVHFIRLLEPRAAGRYEGKNVMLDTEQIQLLETFAADIDTSPQYLSYPLIDYYGANQRRAGCSGAGNRYLYVDTDGNMHACPFCQSISGNVLDASFTPGISNLKQRGCHVYETVAWK